MRSTSPVFSPLPTAHDFNKQSVWCAALTGVELALLQSDSPMLTIWLQICYRYTHPIQSKTP